jgi:ABC-type Zn uptake system ZnuABC Zn-binding protein ZnuA
MHQHPNPHTSLSLNNYKIVNEEAIKAALAEIESAKVAYYYEIATKHELVYTIVIRR